MKLLSIDLGKRTSVTCEYINGVKPKYGKVCTTPAAIEQLFTQLKPDRVVIEIGPSAGWVHDIALKLNIEIQVANVNHEAWRWQNVKRKTDRDDARKLAELSSMNHLPTVHMPSPDVRQWRQLIAYRHNLIKRRTACKNTIRSILCMQGLEMPAKKKGWSEESMQQLWAMTRIKDGQPWRVMLHTELKMLDVAAEQVLCIERKLNAIAKKDARVKQLKSIPGVGDRLAETVVAIIDDPNRFKNVKQVGCYAGLTPRQFQSGMMDRQGRISRRGNTVLRTLLVEVGWLGQMHSPWMKAIYEQVRKGSVKRKQIAVVAVARRLLVVCWAMLRDGTTWRQDEAPSLRAAA